jgi:RHS repeat-associated protein
MNISLPKGGGAIRGIGEKFSAHPATGTASISVPIATSTGRDGFGPKLAISYESGAGNGPFGLGWTLAVPSIARKTEKGLPQYDDTNESDVFILSGAEDLLPAFEKDVAGDWIVENGKPRIREVRRTINQIDYVVRFYRPRVEGLFARIERWTRQTDGDIHWRSFSQDNVLTVYGRTPLSRIADPSNPQRIFSWLICESRDDCGNAALYEYKPEDGAGVDLVKLSESNRGGRDDEGRRANRYLKRIRYGNRTPLLNRNGKRPIFLEELAPSYVVDTEWMFEVVFDYGEHDREMPAPEESGPWIYRHDPFSSYRSCFEVRTTRLCRRVLMFHHIPALQTGEDGYEGLIRSTDFSYSHEDPYAAQTPVYTRLRSVTQTGYRRDRDGEVKRSLPPLEFEYTEPLVQDAVEYVDPASLRNLPIGLDGTVYRWIDLHGEGIPGILTEQAGAWFYKRNISPASPRKLEFAPIVSVVKKPNASIAEGLQFVDFSGDGQPDLVILDGPMPGLFEHDKAEGWQAFRPFSSRLNRDMKDPNLRFVDLDGDGYADVLITEDDALVWHASRAEAGFDPARRVVHGRNEDEGPRLVFDDGTDSIYLADVSGDGLTDLLRIRNGAICYWPNLGYGRFGGKVTMDQAPWFDESEQFDQRRIRLADIDGSGTTDIIYLHREGVRLYFNQSGNSWSLARQLAVFPPINDVVSIAPVDLLGNGTACLVWSSPLPSDAARSMRYVNLMGRKPHLLEKIINNLGNETLLTYAPSTKFYLQDKQTGRPWITRLPFPVHVLERVEVHDRVSRSRFITRYAYHDGHFDGEEREFRGFGMVEHWDAESFDSLGENVRAENEDTASDVPPVHTKTWFHTGMWDENQYYRSPVPNDVYDGAWSLPDTVLPPGLTAAERREACRALKSSMLRQEVYSIDGSPWQDHPYIVVEQNLTVRLEQPRGGNRHAVFFCHAREAVTWHYERSPLEPRIQHDVTIEVDSFGNVLREAKIGYGRRGPDPSLSLQADRDKQAATLIVYVESRYTNAINDIAAYLDDYRTPLPAESRTYELTGVGPEGRAAHFSFEEWTRNDFALVVAADNICFERIPDVGRPQKRLIKHVRTLYRPDDLGASANDTQMLLPLASLQPLALTGESYKLAFTPGLLSQVYRRDGEPLMPNLAEALEGPAADKGGYLPSQQLKADGRFPSTDPDDHWWGPGGRLFLSPAAQDTAAQELAYAQQHFFLAHRIRDPFHGSISTERTIRYDGYDLLMLDVSDAVGNRVSAGERDSRGTIKPGNDYRVLQPARLMDANRNRTHVAFDALGLVAGSAVLGKPEENIGDSLDGFVPDLPEDEVRDRLADPLADPAGLLGRATARVVYDLFAYQNSGDDRRPPTVYTLTRETHDSDIRHGEVTIFQHDLSFSDGFGREVQRKMFAGAGPLTPDEPSIDVRWKVTGWVVLNNKGKPVRQYEPFFSATAGFEFDARRGVSPIIFYDALGRVIGTARPNHTYEKIVFGPWSQAVWDANDTTVAQRQPEDPPFDPKNDPDLGPHFSRLPEDEYLPTWYDLRTDPAKALQAWPDVDKQGSPQSDNAVRRTSERAAAGKAATHAGTPTLIYFDTLGRPFLTLADDGPDPARPDSRLLFGTRITLDIDGRQRAVSDATAWATNPQGRTVMRYAYDMLGSRIHQHSMEAGERFTLNDVSGKAIRSWDSRKHGFRTEFDPLRRPLKLFVSGTDPADPAREVLAERLVYGEQHAEAEQRNLRARLYLRLDQAGAVATEQNDFKGNPLITYRRLTSGTHYRGTVDWTAVDLDDTALSASATARLDHPVAAAFADWLEPHAYVGRTTYDALDRAVTLTTPEGAGLLPSMIRLAYNEARLLTKVDANLRGAAAGGNLTWTRLVETIDYDARGQRQRIDYGNRVTTRYDYDPLTCRLERLHTARDQRGFPDDCPQLSKPDWPGCQTQNLHYTYDPVGNVTSIRDDAQQSIYFRNKRVDPSAEYTYDALYRLIRATGREHLGQVPGAGDPPRSAPHSYNDILGIHLPHPGDGRAMTNYVEHYSYDGAGNLLSIRHHSSDPRQADWMQTFSYREASQLEPEKNSNRLSGTSPNPGVPLVDHYVYDAHGNLLRMPQLQEMQWGFHDELRMSRRQAVANAEDAHGVQHAGERTYYVYDSSGQRVRKVTERSDGSMKNDCIYLAGFEVYRSHFGATAGLERVTLHIMDEARRLALVEMRNDMEDGTAKQLIRYQFGNHVGSVSMELDERGQIISYEEYTPYGSTTYQAMRSQTETPKRYRYTGKERDEESGLCYHGARYYAPWLARWTSPDPAGLADGPNLYRFVRGNPVRLVDLSGNLSQDSDDPLGFQYGDIELSAKQFNLGLEFHDLWDSRRSVSINHGNVDAEFEASARLALPDTNFSAAASAKLRIGAMPGAQRVGVSLYGNAWLNANPFGLETNFNVSASARVPERVPLNEAGLTNLTATISQSLRWDVHTSAELNLGRMSLGAASFAARLGPEGAGAVQASARLSLPTPFGSPTIGIGQLSGTGSISSDGYELAGRFRVASPIGASTGTLSLGSDAGFAARGHYFGLQLGPLALASGSGEAQGLRASTTTFEPGMSIGYSYFQTDASGSRVFSIGAAPHASWRGRSDTQPAAPFPLSMLPSLRGAESRSATESYFGASLRFTF